MSFIGIDLGGTFIKGAILDVDSLRVRKIHRVPFPSFEASADHERIVSPERVFAAFQESLHRLLALEPECEGLLICGQMHALVFCDDRGIDRSQIITWQDQRTLLHFGTSGKTYIELLREATRDVDWKVLGNELRPGLPLLQLFYLKQNNILPEKLYPASLMDFIAAKLCKTAPITDATNAQAHGMFNLSKGTWDFHLIEQLGLDKLAWHEVKPHFTIAGTFSHNRREIPCYVTVGDQQSALLGSFLGERELSLNIATGSQVSLLSRDCELGDYQTRPYFDGHYLKTITHIPAGRAVNALIRLLTEISAPATEAEQIWDYIQNQVQETPNSDLGVEISFFRSPLGEEGKITHMREENMTVGHLFSAVFKTMAENYHRCALRLSPGQEWDRLVFSGGLVLKVPVLQQAILETFGSPAYRINELKEDTLTGLLILAMQIHRGECLLTECANLVRASINGSTGQREDEP
jgi:sugar (pentulose or hexulose) kinase